MTHRIRHQILELELPREAGAVAMQRRASLLFQEQVLPRLDELFSRIAPEGRTLRIDRLDLDLGDITEAGWERDFVEKCVEQIARQVAELAFAHDAQAGVQELSAEENDRAIFRFFLETGAMPWHAKGLTIKELEARLMPQLTPANQSAFTAVWQLLPAQDAAWQRLVWQCSPEFVLQLSATLKGLPENTIAEIVTVVAQQYSHTFSKAQRMALLKQLLSIPAAKVVELAEHPETAMDLLDEILPAGKRQEQVKTAVDIAKQKAGAKMGQDGTENNAAKTPAPTPADKHKTESQLKAQPEGIGVAYAGVVLLAAYLPPFFKNNGIDNLSNEQPEQQYKALHLLHYLAAGKQHPEEHLLILPKILCGLPLETPVPQQFDLTTEDLQRADNLLEAVIRNWAVLKNTSPEGLRSAFFHRDGVLRWNDSRQSWVLQLERKPQDILLDSLPWGYSVVKMPWMEGMLQVEW